MCLSQIKLYGVMVWYHPDQATITYTQQLSQWIRLIVVDNTELAMQRFGQQDLLTAHYINNDGNQGIAHALNKGIQHVQSVESSDTVSSWCVLFDQDSRIDKGFIDQLSTAVQQTDSDVAAIAPSYFDQNLQRKGAVIKLNNGRLYRTIPQGEQRLPASYVISSGCCVNLSAFSIVGEHRTELFIDFVDIEWGLRAEAKGFRIEVIPQLEMTHYLGDRPISVFGIKFVNHSPLRHYYYFRNAIWLCKKTYVPLAWKRCELLKMLPRFAVYALFSDCRRSQIKHMTQGIVHGLVGITGKLSKEIK